MISELVSLDVPTVLIDRLATDLTASEPDGDARKAKLTVLVERVRTHLDDEDAVLLTAIEDLLDDDTLLELGRRIRFVLPMVLERVDVYRMIVGRIGSGARCRARFQRGRHASISPCEGAFAPLATLELASLSYSTEPQRSKQ